MPAGGVIAGFVVGNGCAVGYGAFVGLGFGLGVGVSPPLFPPMQGKMTQIIFFKTLGSKSNVSASELDCAFTNLFEIRNNTEKISRKLKIETRRGFFIFSHQLCGPSTCLPKVVCQMCLRLAKIHRFHAKPMFLHWRKSSEYPQLLAHHEKMA